MKPYPRIQPSYPGYFTPQVTSQLLDTLHITGRRRGVNLGEGARTHDCLRGRVPRPVYLEKRLELPESQTGRTVKKPPSTG